MPMTASEQTPLSTVHFALGRTQAAQWEHVSRWHGSNGNVPRVDCAECGALQSAVAACQAAVTAVEDHTHVTR
jgi:hypothetical protein